MTDKIETNELNFEEMLEESLKSLNTDEKVHGVVVGISPTEVYVDVGRKQAGFIPANELTNDPNAKPEDLVKIGDEMDLLIMKHQRPGRHHHALQEAHRCHQGLGRHLPRLWTPKKSSPARSPKWLRAA